MFRLTRATYFGTDFLSHTHLAGPEALHHDVHDHLGLAAGPAVGPPHLRRGLRRPGLARLAPSRAAGGDHAAARQGSLGRFRVGLGWVSG